MQEQPEDEDAIHQVNLAAFKGGGEAHLVDQLRMSCPTFVSLVAKMDGQVVSHILFTPVDINREGNLVISGMGLAPLAFFQNFRGWALDQPCAKQA